MQEVDDKSYTFTSPHHGQSPHNTRLPGHRSSPHGHRHLLFTTRQLTPTPPPSPLIRRPSWKAQQDFTPSTAQGFPSHFASAGQASSSRQHDTTFSFLPNFPLHTSYDQVNHNHRPEEVTATPSNREFTGSPLELPSITDLYSITPTLLSPLPQPPSPPSRGPSADSLFGTADWRPPPDRGVRFIDLTGDSPPADAMPAMSIRRTTSNLRPARLRSPVYSNPAKRRKLSSEAVKVEQKEIPHIDLRDVDDENDLSKALQREQVAAIKAQQEQTDRPLKLANLQCIICMEPMTDMSVTHCGHLFCHTCLMEALIAGEQQGPDPGKGTSKCPLCRKRVQRPKDGKDKSRQVVSLEIKVVTQGDLARAKTKEKGKAKAVSTG